MPSCVAGSKMSHTTQEWITKNFKHPIGHFFPSEEKTVVVQLWAQVGRALQKNVFEAPHASNSGIFVIPIGSDQTEQTIEFLPQIFVFDWKQNLSL